MLKYLVQKYLGMNKIVLISRAFELGPRRVQGKDPLNYGAKPNLRNHVIFFRLPFISVFRHLKWYSPLTIVLS